MYRGMPVTNVISSCRGGSVCIVYNINHHIPESYYRVCHKESVSMGLNHMHRFTDVTS